MAELYCPKCYSAMAVDLALDGPLFISCSCGLQYVPGRMSRDELDVAKKQYQARVMAGAGKKRNIPIETQGEIVTAYGKGLSGKDVGIMFGVSSATVFAYVEKFGAPKHKQGAICAKERIL